MATQLITPVARDVPRGVRLTRAAFLVLRAVAAFRSIPLTLHTLTPGMRVALAFTLALLLAALGLVIAAMSMRYGGQTHNAAFLYNG